MKSEKRAQKFHTDDARVNVISMEFLRLGLRRHLAGKPVVVSSNVGCFLRLRIIVLTSLVYPCFELDIEQDRMRKPLLIRQETD